MTAITRRPSVLIACASVALTAALVHGSSIAQPPLQTPRAPLPADFFEARVRPILAEHCYECHTDDEKGGLRLDSRGAMIKGGDEGPAIVAGDPDGSLLIQAVRHLPEKPKMPKGSSRRKLTPEEIDAIAEWIRAGAPWPESNPSAAAAALMSRGKAIGAEERAFWSFQPIHASPAPVVKDTAWPKTGIDRFVLARLEKEGMAPVAAADKRTLLRRATLGLTGLPPTPEEFEAFDKDTSADAFAKVVDRLLASPQYGETWGRLWLDVARFGEDDYRSLDPMGRGYNPYPNAYLYRDWVTKAFNDDMPYDTFVRAQIAGDLLDEKVRLKMLPALGFLGLGPWFYDNGAVEITRADERHDRVDVVSRGFLGLTVGCARCHDHKYDAIPTKDYYSMAGVFLNTSYQEYPLVPKSLVDEYTAAEKKLEKKEELVGKFLRTESEQLAETLALQSARYMKAAWRVTGEPKEEVAKAVEKDKLDYELFDRWLRFLSKAPTFYPYLKKWQAMVKQGGTAEEAATLADEFQALVLEVILEQKQLQEENDVIIAKALPGTKKKEPGKLPSDFVTNDDFCPKCGLELKSLPTEQNHLYTDLFRRDVVESVSALDKAKPALLAFTGWGLERQLSAERRQYIDEMRKDVAAMRKKLPAKYAFVHGVRDVEKPEPIKVHVRGSAFKFGDEVPRRFLTVLSPETPPPFARGSGRLDLADAIVAQPITARVIVNRIWKGHFGTGIVDSPSNFGIAGERPTNPELLEHLAQFFIDRKLSIKALHKEIMLSSVYALGSHDSKVNSDKDAGNRFYWRATRQRMSAEQIRDSVLFVAGELDTRIGGPSAALTPFYKRRTVYGKVSRYKLDQYLQLFDFPSANLSSEKRFTTNVPLQRLFFMNSDFMQQESELVAKRVAGEPDTRAKIVKTYRLIFGRDPLEPEIRAGLDYLAAEPMKAYEERKAEKEKADAAAKADPKAVKVAAKKADDADKDKAEIMNDGMMMGVVPDAGAKEDKKKLIPATPWGRYVKVLLSSNEFLFID